MARRVSASVSPVNHSSVHGVTFVFVIGPVVGQVLSGWKKGGGFGFSLNDQLKQPVQSFCGGALVPCAVAAAYAATFSAISNPRSRVTAASS